MYLLFVSVLLSTLSLFANAQSTLPGTSSMKDLALAARPYWKFSRAAGHDTCWPTKIMNGEEVVSKASLKKFPDASGGCGEAMSSFEVYWNGLNCSTNEVRVVYNLLFPKDGFYFLGTSLFGHAYDWERVIVVFKRNTSNHDWNYRRDGAYYSAHTGYHHYNWEDLKTSNSDSLNTLSKNLDHPTAYSSWAKHPMYKDANECPLSIADELTDNAFRNDYYKYFNTEAEMVEVVPQGTLWKTMAEYSWGEASSYPPNIYNKICSVST